MDEIFKPLLSGKNPLPPKFNVNVTWSALAPMDENKKINPLTSLLLTGALKHWDLGVRGFNIVCIAGFYFFVHLLYCFTRRCLLALPILVNTALVLLAGPETLHAQWASESRTLATKAKDMRRNCEGELVTLLPLHIIRWVLWPEKPNPYRTITVVTSQDADLGKLAYN